MGESDAKAGSLWTWIGVGCGGLLFLGVAGSCVGPALFGIMMAEGMGAMGGGMPSVAPMTGPGGAQSGLVLPEAPGPIQPLGAGDPAPVSTADFQLVVTGAEFAPGVGEGTVCPFTVSHVERSPGSFWCRTELTCGGKPLYGLAGQGYFACTWPEGPEDLIEGWDLEQSALDGDPSFIIESHGGLTLEDGQLRVEGTVQRLAPLNQLDTLRPPDGVPAEVGEPASVQEEPGLEAEP